MTKGQRSEVHMAKYCSRGPVPAVCSLRNVSGGSVLGVQLQRVMFLVCCCKGSVPGVV